MTIASADPRTAVPPAASGGAASRLRLAYLTTEYPKVSHTFIRREIVELERRGHYVLRLAIRDGGGAIADPADQEEHRKTIHCLSLPKLQLLLSAIIVKASNPLRWLRALRMTLRMSRASDRGFLRHAAYLIEAAALLRILRRERIDHVHVHFGTNAAAVARLIRCLGGERGPTYSFTIHGPDEFDSPRAFSLGEKVHDAAFTVAISDFCGAQIRRWSAFDDWNRVHVVHCTVGSQFFDHARPVDPASRTLVSVGRLSAQKGQLLLVEALRRVLDSGVEMDLVLAGDGEMRSEIEGRIAQLGLQGRVAITGWIGEQEVRDHLLAARALVQSSFAEGLPVVIMESLAMARPVISTAIAGIPELVRHGENGWLVPAGSVDELAAAMREAMTASTERLDRMGLAGQARVRDRHFTPTEAAKLESLFDQYAASCGGGGPV